MPSLHYGRAHLATLLLLVAISAVFVANGSAQIWYPSNGAIRKVDAAQLWYNGYWKHPGWINATIMMEDEPDVTGAIVVIGNELPPYDKFIIRAKERGAIALVVIRDRSGTAGQAMYYVDGSDQSKVTIPAVEVYERRKTANGLWEAIVPGGIPVSIWPGENAWKKANDVTAFQVAFNVILSSMELAVLLIGAWRLNQWTYRSWDRLFSIGPICIILDMVSAVLRFMDTLVDPFASFRTYTANFSLTIITSSFPFFLASGILLTFFWAETLRVSRVKASPFIAEYKKSAAVAIFLLFVGEISSVVVRLLIPVTGSFNPGHIAQAWYGIVCLLLTISFLICAYKIQHRLGKANRRTARYIRNMNIRFALSTAGYIGILGSLLASISLMSYPWGWKIIFNLIFLFINFSSLLQVYSLKPASNSSHSHSSTPGAKSGSIGSAHSMGDTADSAPLSARPDSHSSSSEEPQDPPEEEFLA